MGWSIGYDNNWDRDIGYGVPAICDYPTCKVKIDRGLSYVCGGEPFGGEYGCGLFFCGKHLSYTAIDISEGRIITSDSITIPPDDLIDYAPLCERCTHEKYEPFEAKPDVPKWVRHKLRHGSWAQWREEHKAEVEKMKASLIK